MSFVEYYRVTNECVMVVGIVDLSRDGFERQPPAFSCKVAELGGAGVGGRGQVVGYALYFPTYSTWEGRAMMLEDLYVRPAERRRGLGQRLFHSVAKVTTSTYLIHALFITIIILLGMIH